MVLTHVTGTVTTTVSLPGALLPLSKRTDRDIKMGVTGSGAVKVYDNSVNEYFIPVKIRINETQRSALNSFIRTTVAYAYATFSVTPDAGVDFGAGAATAVAVRYWDRSYEETHLAPAWYEVGLVFRREAT